MPLEVCALSPEKMELREYEVPKVGTGQMKVQSMYAAAKHGTELSGIKGDSAKRGPYDPELQVFPNTGKGRSSRTGNMFVGTVIGEGVDGFAEGDVVLSYGPFREVHVISTERCWKVPEGFSWKSAVCLDPADFAMCAIRDGQVRVGDAVAVFGMGAIGLMVVQIAKLSGAYPIIAVDPLENRQKVAQICGADLILDPTTCDAGVEIKKATENRGVDVAIDYSANVHALQAAIRGVAFGGNVVAGAAPAPYGPGLDLGAEAHYNRPNLIFSRSCSDPNREYPRWDEKRVYATCWRLLTEGKLTGESIVTPIVAFEDLVAEYPKITSNPEQNIKLGAYFN